MYQQEVPQYGTLMELVQQVNEQSLIDNPALKTRLQAADELERLNLERHCAIRVGTPQELATLRQMRESRRHPGAARHLYAALPGANCTTSAAGWTG